MEIVLILILDTCEIFSKIIAKNVLNYYKVYNIKWYYLQIKMFLILLNQY